MLRKLVRFWKKKLKKGKWIDIYSPVNGTVIPLSEVPDAAFAEKMMGDGCAIEIIEGAVYSPIDAEEIDIFPPGPVMYFTSYNENIFLELTFQLGITDAPTVLTTTLFDLDSSKHLGIGIKRCTDVTCCQKGDKILEYDYEILKKEYMSLKSPFIISNLENVEKIEVVRYGEIKAGELIMRVFII